VTDCGRAAEVEEGRGLYYLLKAGLSPPVRPHLALCPYVTENARCCIHSEVHPPALRLRFPPCYAAAVGSAPSSERTAAWQPAISCASSSLRRWRCYSAPGKRGLGEEFGTGELLVRHGPDMLPGRPCPLVCLVLVVVFSRAGIPPPSKVLGLHRVPRVDLCQSGRPDHLGGRGMGSGKATHRAAVICRKRRDGR